MKIKMNKAIYKYVIGFFITFFLFATFFYSNVVKADDSNDSNKSSYISKYIWDDYRASVVAKGSKGSNYGSSYVIPISLDGITVFCIEPTQILNNDKTYKKIDNYLGNDKLRLIESIAYHGYYKYIGTQLFDTDFKYEGGWNAKFPTSRQYYSFTQLFIWEALGEMPRRAKGESSVKNYDDYIVTKIDFTHNNNGVSFTGDVINQYKEWKKNVAKDVKDELDKIDISKYFDKTMIYNKVGEKVTFTVNKDIDLTKYQWININKDIDVKISKRNIDIIPKKEGTYKLNFSKDLIFKSDPTSTKNNKLGMVPRINVSFLLGYENDQKVAMIKATPDPSRFSLTINTEKIRTSNIKTTLTINGNKEYDLTSVK